MSGWTSRMRTKATCRVEPVKITGFYRFLNLEIAKIIREELKPTRMTKKK